MTLTLDGNVVTSSGELENNERVSGAVHKAINLLQIYKPEVTSSQQSEETYKKVSFVYPGRAYVFVRCGNKVLVTMRQVPEIPNIGQLMTHSNDDCSS